MLEVCEYSTIHNGDLKRKKGGKESCGQFSREQVQTKKVPESSKRYGKNITGTGGFRVAASGGLHREAHFF